MIIIDNAKDMLAWTFSRRAEGKSIGFVPTMGALHEGHASLMRSASAENDVAVASLFVNPTQFAPNEDFDKYPRTFEADCALCEASGIAAIYAPKASGMYPEGYATYVNVERVSDGLCSGTRPHFFRGVATVVTKLFNAVLPDRAYFGQKDAQQCAVIRRMTRDLDFSIEIVECPTVREADGLAMSSRNRYLSTEERVRGLSLSRALFAALDLMKAGERRAESVLAAARAELGSVRLDYLTLVDAEEMTPLETVRGKVLLAVAAWVGETRLIDKIKFEVPQS